MGLASSVQKRYTPSHLPSKTTNLAPHSIDRLLFKRLCPLGRKWAPENGGNGTRRLGTPAGAADENARGTSAPTSHRLPLPPREGLPRKTFAKKPLFSQSQGPCWRDCVNKPLRWQWDLLLKGSRTAHRNRVLDDIDSPGSRFLPGSVQKPRPDRATGQLRASRNSLAKRKPTPPLARDHGRTVLLASRAHWTATGMP